MVVDERSNQKCIDFNMWGRMPYWTIHEAVSLLNNTDPVQEAASKVSRETAKRSVGIWELVQRAIEVNRISDPVEPILFLEWAMQNELCVPKTLLDAIIKYHDVQVDWKAEAETQRHRAERAEGAFGHYLKLAAKREKQIREMWKFIASLEERTKGTSDGAKVAALQKSLNSVLKLLGGMAIAVYNFNPHEKRSDLVKQIQNDLDLKGVNLDEDTIRKWIKEGARLALNLESQASKPKSVSSGRRRPNAD